MKKYSDELKSKLIALHLSEGRSMASLEKEYNLSKGCVSNWVKSYSKECQNNMEKMNDELKKENLFLKKAAAFFADDGK